MQVYDITLPLQSALAGWPGDTPYRFDLAWQKSEGASVNVGAVALSVHAGTHADAPFHFQDHGATIDTLELYPFFGPAVVIDVVGKATISISDLEGADLSRAPRVLFKTNAWIDHARFPDTIPVLNPEVVLFLQRQRVVLVGVDVPSVDPLDSKALFLHHALASANIQILENLYLALVPAGFYTLVALPLKLVGADAAPVRAILVQNPVPGMPL